MCYDTHWHVVSCRVLSCLQACECLYGILLVAGRVVAVERGAAAPALNVFDLLLLINFSSSNESLRQVFSEGLHYLAPASSETYTQVQGILALAVVLQMHLLWQYAQTLALLITEALFHVHTQPHQLVCTLDRLAVLTLDAGIVMFKCPQAQ